MGSGRGKTRRAQQVQHATDSAPGAFTHMTVDEEKWDNFTRNCDLANLGIYNYYLGQKAPLTIFQVQELAADEHMKIVRELFADAVSVGAITLPEPYKAEDFELQPSPDYDDEVLIKMKGNPELTKIVQNVSLPLSANPLLDDQVVIDSLYEFLTGVRGLLEQTK